MSNINKQASKKLKAAAAKAVDNFDPNMFVETRDVLALLDELEAAESRIAEVRGYNVDLAEESRQYQQRVSELEAREVKLPEAMMPARHNSGELFMSPDNVEYGGYLNRDDVVRALRAAGIITKVGE